MDIQHPNRKELTSEEQQQLDRLKKVIEQATADGKLTQTEIERIKAVIWADGRISPEELAMVSELVKKKIASGDLAIEW